MKFFSVSAALLGIAASAFAQDTTPDFNPIFSPENGQVVPAGTTFKITWTTIDKYAGETVSLHLIGGATQGTQIPLLDIASGIPSSALSFDWAVDASLGKDAVYGLVIRLESNPAIFQFSNPFSIDGPVDVETTTTGAGSATASATDATTTLTATSGVKTITLSTTVVSTSTAVTTSSTSEYVSKSTFTTVHTAYNNCTSLCHKASSTVVVVEPTKGGASPSKTDAPPAEVTTGAAARLGAAPFAAVAGLMIAAFAL